MKYNRKTKWFTLSGQVVTVEGMGDEHLANTIQFLSHYGKNDSLLAEMRREAKRRGLGKDFLSRAQFPYKDGQGNYLVWDFKKNGPKKVGSYVR